MVLIPLEKARILAKQLREDPITARLIKEEFSNKADLVVLLELTAMEIWPDSIEAALAGFDENEVLKYVRATFSDDQILATLST